MTVAVCTNCGKIKFGAWCVCSVCKSQGLDGDISLLLSDHYLSEKELNLIGEAIRIIFNTGLDEEKRYHLLAYYLSLKWPRLLEYSIDKVKSDLQKTVREAYFSQLAHLPGQKYSSLKASDYFSLSWSKAINSEYQQEDNSWQEEVITVVLEGVNIVKDIVLLKIAVGEGAIVQILTHQITSIFQTHDYLSLLHKSSLLEDKVMVYISIVDTFCNRVKNAWSERTKKQAAYLKGLSEILEKMFTLTKIIIEHKSGINRLIKSDLKRVRKELNKYKNLYFYQFYIVMEPTRINPNGTISSKRS